MDIFIKILADYIKPIYEFFHMVTTLYGKKTIYLFFLVCIITFALGDSLCPYLYKQYKEFIGVSFIISFASLLFSIGHSLVELVKNKYGLYKRDKLKLQNRYKIFEALKHLNPIEEKIIKSMIMQNKNNTSSFGSRYTCDLDGLYEQGILCQRNIHETSILESEIDYMDPILWEEYTPIRDYKMPGDVWENAKNNPQLNSDEDIPF